MLEAEVVMVVVVVVVVMEWCVVKGPSDRINSPLRNDNLSVADGKCAVGGAIRVLAAATGRLARTFDLV